MESDSRNSNLGIENPSSPASNYEIFDQQGVRSGEQTLQVQKVVKKRNSKSKKKLAKSESLPAATPANESEGPKEHQTEPVLDEEASFLENIKTEWNLFWAGLIGEDEAESVREVPSGQEVDFISSSIHPKAQKREALLKSGKLQSLTIEQVKQITRALSQDRKMIHQRIEQINREIELNSERLESIKLVGGDSAETIEEINKLNDVGMKLSLELQRVSQQLDQFRSREDELKGLR